MGLSDSVIVTIANFLIPNIIPQKLFALFEEKKENYLKTRITDWVLVLGWFFFVCWNDWMLVIGLLASSLH